MCHGHCKATVDAQTAGKRRFMYRAFLLCEPHPPAQQTLPVLSYIMLCGFLVFGKISVSARIVKNWKDYGENLYRGREGGDGRVAASVSVA